MAEGGFDPNDPNSFEMNEDTPDDDPSEDLSLIDVSQNNPEFSTPEGSRQETSFSTPVESMLIESYRDKFKKMYRINDETFNKLIPN